LKTAKGRAYASASEQRKRARTYVTGTRPGESAAPGCQQLRTTQVRSDGAVDIRSSA
jgi:hypothetical protein